MAVPQVPRVAFISPPFFFASWVGRTSTDKNPRMVLCFGPSESDDLAAMHAAVLGLESLQSLRGSPVLDKAWADLDQQRLVLHVVGYDGHDCEVLRTDPLPDSLLAVLGWRPEVLLLWVDVPLREPLAQLASVGLSHLWTGVARVRNTARFSPCRQQGRGVVVSDAGGRG